jgi:hypothetical protein
LYKQEENVKSNNEIVVPVMQLGQQRRNRIDNNILEINKNDIKRNLYETSNLLRLTNKRISPSSGGSEHDSGQEDDDECVNANTPLMTIKRSDQAVSYTSFK